MSFEDLIFLLNDASQKTISEFFSNIHLYLKSEDFHSFIEFVTQNDKKLLKKFQLHKQ